MKIKYRENLKQSVGEIDFRLFLQQELVRRCQSNPKYSLRAFANFLQVDASFLSKVLNRKRPLTEAMIHQFACRLELDPKTTKKILDRETRYAPSLYSDQVDYTQISLDHFRMIADWYHYAILELIKLDTFEPSTKWVARTLGISAAEAKSAIERLERLEFLEVSTKGKWINKSGNNTTVGSDFTDAAFRKLQRTVLEKAIAALDEVPFSLRDQTSMTLVTDPTYISEAKKRIKKFRRELTEYLESAPSKKAVYHLGISLYPVTKTNL